MPTFEKIYPTAKEILRQLNEIRLHLTAVRVTIDRVNDIDINNLEEFFKPHYLMINSSLTMGQYSIQGLINFIEALTDENTH